MRVTEPSHRTAAVIAVLAVAYVAMLVPANITGAKDYNMLAAFKIDEYSNVQIIVQMLSGGRSIRGALWNFVVYWRWYYGYPFFLVSALAVAPLRLFVDFSNTTAYMLVLRELSPLFMAAAVGFLVYLQTGFESLIESVVLFVFLAAIPALFLNSLWWHPDGLSILLVVLTIFALERDGLRFGRWFYAAAVCCGLAAGVKLAGFWFFLTIAVYLAMDLQRTGVAAAIRRGAIFTLVMLATLVLSNPLLLWPTFARQIIAMQRDQGQQVLFGWDVRMESGVRAWYSETLRPMFGGWWIFVIALGAAIVEIMRPTGKRLLHIIIVTWAVPLSIFLLTTVAIKGERHALPVLLPLFSCCLGARRLLSGAAGILRVPQAAAARVAKVVTLLLLSIQTVAYARTDASTYRERVERETRSPALAFYRELDHAYLSGRNDRRLKIFRDPFVYVPPRPDVETTFVWRSAEYGDVDRQRPDLILLQQEYVTTYADPSRAGVSFNRQQAEASRLFYADAADDRLRGYHRIMATPFGVAFARNEQ